MTYDDQDLFFAWVKYRMGEEGCTWMDVPDEELNEEQLEASWYYWAQKSLSWEVI